MPTPVRILISTHPFAQIDRSPVCMLEEANITYQVNPYGRKLTENELKSLIFEFDVLIAGTEPITDSVLSAAKNLKLIARVGIGLDSVDLVSARKRGILVSYTPDAPSPSVAELTISLMLSLLRQTHLSNAWIRKGQWSRYFGRRLSESTVGIIGVGRIGKLVVELLLGLRCRRILVNDVDSSVVDELEKTTEFIEVCSKDEIYQEADIISVHVPLTDQTLGMISHRELSMMKEDALIVNTSRGGIIEELGLYDLMDKGHLGGAAIDVFEEEPYSGPLTEIDRCVLTAHMGSMTYDSRARMELEAAEDVVRFSLGRQLKRSVPESEYEIQS